MTPERSGQDRRSGWGPLCEAHEAQTDKVLEIGDDVLVLKTRIAIWGSVISVLIMVGICLAGWAFSVARDDNRQMISVLVATQELRGSMVAAASERAVIAQRIALIETRQNDVLQRLSKVEASQR